MYANTIGNYNSALGVSALANNNTGIENVAVGYNALNQNTGGGSNTSVGVNSLATNITGTNNTALGWNTLFKALGTGNTGIGYGALYNTDSGNTNTAVGNSAGNTNTTGSNNVFLGNTVNGFNASSSNQIVIGSTINGVSGSNYITMGSAGNVVWNQFTVNATWTRTSDERVKRNINDDTLGLSFINRLRTVTYQHRPSYDIPQELTTQYSEENHNETETVMHGLVAQEVKAALDAEGVDTFGGWSELPDGTQAVSREMFVIPLIRAVKELSAKVEELSLKVEELQKKVN
jgi:hypothetical protein